MPLKFDDGDFVAWREHPITRHVLDVFLQDGKIEAQKRSAELAWVMNLDPIQHACLRERYSVIEQIQTLKYEDLESHDEEHTHG